MYIARQAIFNRSLKVYGYELLFRGGMQSAAFDGVSSVQASASVLGGLFENGIHQIVDDKIAFVNFDNELIQSGTIELIEPGRLIVEVLEDTYVDLELIQRLLILKEKGYKIALDDFEESRSTYALAQEHIRIHNTIDEFLYKEELLNLKKEFYGYYSKKIEEYLMGDFVDIKTIGSRIVCINDHVVYGEKKTFKGGNYIKAPTAPRYLQFFPEQDPELYDKYEETMQKALISAKKSNTTKDTLNHLELSILPDPANILDGNGDKVIKEISFYVWKKIQLNFEQSKDQWLILGKIYECYMEGHRLKMAEGSAKKKIEHRELQMQWARKAVNALRIRAELHGDYDDWYDIYQFYHKRAGAAVNEKEKLDWIKLAYELDLEIVYRVHNDADRIGRHFTGLLDYLDKDENYFALCIRNEKSIADRYLEELKELYNQHRQYRYLDFAFKIAKVAGNCELYLRKFLKVLLQWEMVKLIRNILDLLFEEKYSVAQLFYDDSVKHIDSIPRILNLTHELMEGLGSEKADRFKRILTLLEFYPNATYRVNIEKGSDETSMLEEVMDLQFVINYYAATKELIGELDCSSIQRALYLMYQELYSRTMKEEYLKKMFDALEVYAVETENLPFLYKGITLRYRHETLNSYTVSIIEKGKLSPEITDKLKKYQDRLENLKISYGSTQSEFFQELCDLTIYYSEKDIVVKLKAFIKKYILSGRNKMTEDLRDYFMSFKMIGKVWLQLYREENEEAIKKSFPARYTIGFDSVNRVIHMLEDSNKRNQSLLNLDILGECVSYSKEWDNPHMVRLVEDYLENNEAYSEEGVVMLHHFFALMAKGNEDTLYRVIDKINEHHQYKGKQGIDLLEKLYEKTEDTNYLKGLARQYAKAGSYEMAEACYKELSENMVNNPKVKTQILAMSFLIWVKNKEEIKISEMEKLGEKQVCEVLAYLSQKYPHEISGVMNRMDEEGRNLLGFIHQLMSLEEKAGAFRDAYEEEVEENLWKALLTLKDTRYFSCLLPNLYQRSRNKKFKYSIENPKDDGLKTRIRRILEEGNHKPILVLYGDGMKPGQELIFMDYDLPAENADRNASKEKNSIPFLQKVMDDFHTTKEVRPISDLFHQLEGEKSAHRRKDILLHILTNQSDRSEETERDAALPRKLQLSKAELGYLLHLERFGKKDYEISVRMLHEGTVCLGSSKADCNYLLEEMREQYCKVLEAIPELPFDKGLEYLSLIMDGIDKIIKLFNENWNNSRNVFLRDISPRRKRNTLIIICRMGIEVLQSHRI
ncbi:hypothetical protein HNQ56_003612 [Anaerotaenia torta]|uniref:hypothetical protein n=1 Tax=Anaerotaenia torta TaxID=433293 RepID=UPI003D1EED5A